MKHSIILTLFFMLLMLLNSHTSDATTFEEYPAKSTELTFNSFGNKMSGIIYQAKGRGPHPTALILHGYPGNEKNLDVAQALRLNGWNALFFHYRGAWGSEGEFSFSNAEQDVQTVLEYLSDEGNANSLGVDPKQLSIVGHSMGGHMAIAGILENAKVKCSVAYDGANLGVSDVGVAKDPETTIPWKEYSDTLFMLNGWSGQKMEKELKQHSKKLNLVRRVNSINGRPVLLIAADTDVVPMKSHILPLLSALKETPNSNISYKLIDDDHSFNNSRELLINTTINFLNANCLVN